jgi:ATP-dependent helicase/nuclease subunit B
MAEPETSRWYFIPANRPFLDDLAAGLLATLKGPEQLPAALVLVPTRRGGRALAEAFLKASGGQALLLPQIRALGDLDEGEPPFEPGDIGLDLPPAIEPLQRRFELAALVDQLSGQTLTATHALDLADALAAFLDAAMIEGAPVAEKLAGLVDLDLAEHWQVSARLLELALETWPRRLAQLGLMDVAERRVRLLDLLAERWTSAPPSGPVIAAGSTGSTPATARLLKVIAGLPGGAVVLPGLDCDLADSAWSQIDDQHPQAALKRLLDQAGLARTAVREWRPVADMRGRWRRRLINEALRPASATDDWLNVIAALKAEAGPGIDPFAQGLQGLTDIVARSEDEAATICALLMRESLEAPDQTCALVTPDQGLARRVTARLARWNIDVDSTAGVPLTLSPVGALVLGLAGLAIDPLDPVGQLQVLKSPLSRLGRSPEDLQSDREALERYGLRGPRPADAQALGDRLAAVSRRSPVLAGAIERAAGLSRDLAALVIPLAACFETGLADAGAAASALALALEGIAEGGAERGAERGDSPWSGPDGEALSRLLADLIRHGPVLPRLSPQAFVNLVQGLLSQASVRGGETTHPRLHIMGALEARMTRADRLILAGLEEGIWPRGGAIDPFLSRPMRKTLGLPSPERRVGLSAHDFSQAACAPEVALVSTARRGGAPATPSRWLWRLRTLVKGALGPDARDDGASLPTRPDLAVLASWLDAPDGYRPVPRPAPVPPVEDRPRTLAVTRMEALTRDPYSVWARDILRLFPLDRPDQLIESRARGTAIHEAFELLARDWNPADGLAASSARFEALYLDRLLAQGLTESAMAREQALAREAADWAAAFETRRRADGRSIHVEVKGQMTLDVQGVLHVLTAKSDRIELTPEGLAHILDFKTGSAPTLKMVDTGFSPQLTLTAAILAAGGFSALAERARIFGDLAPGDLTYVKITGRNPAGLEETRKSGDKTLEAADRAVEGARSLLGQYLDPARGYASRIAPQFVKSYPGDHDHLARVFEWSTGGDGDEPE